MNNVNNPEKEIINLDERCQLWIFRKNGFVCIGIEKARPEALIVMAGLIHILGEPESYTYKDGDDFVAFIWKDKSIENDITQSWRKAFFPTS